MGPKYFPDTILENGSKKDWKKEKDYHIEKANESMKDVAEGTPAKTKG